MAHNYNTIKAYNNFITYMKRGKVQFSKRLAAHIFDSFFSLTNEPKNTTFQITREMYFKDEVGFESWRKKLITLQVVELIDRKKQLHKLGGISMKYLNDAYEEMSLFPSPLQLMSEIKKLKETVKKNDQRIKTLELEMSDQKTWKEEVIKMFPKVVELTLIKGGKDD